MPAKVLPPPAAAAAAAAAATTKAGGSRWSGPLFPVCKYEYEGSLHHRLGARSHDPHQCKGV